MNAFPEWTKGPLLFGYVVTSLFTGCGMTPANAPLPASTSPEAGTQNDASATSPGDGGGGDDGGTVGNDAGASVGTEGGPPDVRFVGRMSGASTQPSFEWEGASILANFTGTQVVVTMLGDPSQSNYFAVLIDGVRAATLVVNGATPTSYPLATGLSAGRHSVLLFRRAESFQGTTQFLGFDFGPGGVLLPPPARSTRRIEFIGDSITAGYGVECPNASVAFSAATENEYLAYGSITARDLGAEAHIIAWSGEGVYRNYGGSPGAGTLMPDYWRRTLPTIPTSGWDFSQWTPDVVVVNLGTNDFSTTPPADIAQQFQASYTAFVQLVHKTYPNAYIFCALGPMLIDPHLTEARTALSGAVSALKTGGFGSIALVEFPPQSCGADGSGCGCDYHPSMATHAQMATTLEAAIHTAVGW